MYIWLLLKADWILNEDWIFTVWISLKCILYIHASIKKWLLPACLSPAVTLISFNYKISTWTNQHCATVDEAATITKKPGKDARELLKGKIVKFFLNTIMSGTPLKELEKKIEYFRSYSWPLSCPRSPNYYHKGINPKKVVKVLLKNPKMPWIWSLVKLPCYIQSVQTSSSLISAQTCLKPTHLTTVPWKSSVC